MITAVAQLNDERVSTMALEIALSSVLPVTSNAETSLKWSGYTHRDEESALLDIGMGSLFLSRQTGSRF